MLIFGVKLGQWDNYLLPISAVKHEWRIYWTGGLRKDSMTFGVP